MIIAFVVNVFSQKNMVTKTNDQVKSYVSETYGDLDLITQNYSDQYAYVYITKDACKLTFYFSKNRCHYQRIDYPASSYGEDMISKLDSLFERKSTDLNKKYYVWIERVGDISYEWDLSIKNNYASLVIKKSD